MSLLIAFFLGGVLTILSPCIVPVMPFVLARVHRPFASHGLPMVLGMAAAFALVACLATVAGHWAVALIHYGRAAAIVVLAVFGLALLFPAPAHSLARWLVTADSGPSVSPRPDEAGAADFVSPALLGVSAGLLWVPCVGPILGLILADGSAPGRGLEASLQLTAYALGTAASLAAALLAGGRVLSNLNRPVRTGPWIRRASGLAALAALGAMVLGLDAGLLSRLSRASTTAVEEAILERLAPRPAPGQPSDERRPGQAPDARRPSDVRLDHAFLRELGRGARPVEIGVSIGRRPPWR